MQSLNHALKNSSINNSLRVARSGSSFPSGLKRTIVSEAHKKTWSATTRGVACEPVGFEFKVDMSKEFGSMSLSGSLRGESAVCHAKKGKYGESYAFQVIRGDDEEDEFLFRRFKRGVISGHVLLEARRRRFFERKIAKHKRKLKMKSIEKKMKFPIMTMAQRREMEAAGKIPGYNPLTRSPFLADIEPVDNMESDNSNIYSDSEGQKLDLSGDDVDVDSLFGSKPQSE